MAETVITDLREFDLNKVNPTGFVNNVSIDRAIKQLSEIKIIVDELLNIREREENVLPQEIKIRIIQFSTEIFGFINRIEKIEDGSSDVIARKKDRVITDIENFYHRSFNLSITDSTRLLEIYSIAKSFSNNDSIYKKELETLKTSISNSITQSNELIEKISDNKLIEDLEAKRDESETILNELKKKTSEQTVSDYAEVFQKNAENHKKFAERWIIAGIFLAVIFIVFLIIITKSNFLPTEEINEITGKLIRYNFTNLVAKILIIAVIVFLMSFSFKQYSINRHQQTLNTHRQNALNSYQLFTKSIVGDDTNSRNSLMIQVAKAIYENSQSTGFLNEKGQNVNSGLIEITKLIGQNGI